MKYLIAVAGLSLLSFAIAQAEEKVIQFTTLPEVVRTTVIQKTRVPSPEKVVKVVELPEQIYQVTVLTDSGEQVIYVTETGSIVDRPSTVVEGESEGGSAEVTVTMEEIQSGGTRYAFVQNEGPDAIYIDHQTNKRVIVKGAAGQRSQGGVRTKEESRGGIRNEEQNQGGGRGNNEPTNRGSSTVHERTDEGNINQGQKEMRKDEGTQKKQRTPGNQMNQENRQMPGTGREPSGNERNPTDEQGRNLQKNENRNPGQQESKQKSIGKEKASPTP